MPSTIAQEQTACVSVVKLSLSDLVPKQERAKLRSGAKAWNPATKNIIRPPPGLADQDSEDNDRVVETAAAAEQASAASTSVHSDDEDNISSNAGGTPRSSNESDSASTCDTLATTPAKEAEPQPEKVKLNTDAKLWKPMASMTKMAGPMFLPPEVSSCFEAVFSAGHAALKTCTFVSQVHQCSTTRAWSLMGCVDRVPAQQLRMAFSLVQNALLKAAEQSASVYIVGYEAAPFIPARSGLGFSARLALVPDESTACWSLLSTGVCNQGSGCTRRHPSWQVSIDVVIQSSRSGSL